jgi:hypothetical protein
MKKQITFKEAQKASRDEDRKIRTRFGVEEGSDELAPMSDGSEDPSRWESEWSNCT